MTVPMNAQRPDPGGGAGLDKARWDQWRLSNAAGERRNTASWMVAVKIAAIAVVAATTLPWAYQLPYQLPIRLALSLGALAALNQAVRAGMHVFAALFAAIVVIYNPLYPVFEPAIGWPYPLPLFTVAAFSASLYWPDSQAEQLIIPSRQR